MTVRVPVGLLYSVTGTYQAIGRDCLDGALMALEEVNADPSFAFAFEPVVGDPGASIARYHELSETMLRERRCRQVVGTITSISRKEVIPIIEKHDALLWYMCPYEGFECCESVIYTGACPNQHILPLFRHLIPSFGARPYLVGSNYIWGWETNRIARELIVACGGEVLGEKYLPLDSVEVDRLIDEIRKKKPDFVLNNLIGPSSYAFFKAYRALTESDPDFAPARRPIVSCNLTECELDAIGLDAAAGHLSSAIYFESAETPENRAFRARVAARYGAGRRTSAFFVGGYLAMRMLGEAIREAGSDESEAVKAVVHGRSFDSPLGAVRVDASTNHAALAAYLARITPAGSFEIFSGADEPIAADPYLVDFEAQDLAALLGRAQGREARQHLRLVK